MFEHYRYLLCYPVMHLKWYFVPKHPKRRSWKIKGIFCFYQDIFPFINRPLIFTDLFMLGSSSRQEVWLLCEINIRRECLGSVPEYFAKDSMCFRLVWVRNFVHLESKCFVLAVRKSIFQRKNIQMWMGRILVVHFPIFYWW